MCPDQGEQGKRRRDGEGEEGGGGEREREAPHHHRQQHQAQDRDDRRLAQSATPIKDIRNDIIKSCTVLYRYS